jgi:hypothetical protein
MEKFKIDKKELANFVLKRQSFSLTINSTIGLMLVSGLLKYDFSDKTTANLIGFFLIYFVILMILIGFILLLKKFNSTISTFLKWDKNIEIVFTNGTIQIRSDDLNQTCELKQLKVSNYKFYGGRSNPLFGLGYADLLVNDRLIRVPNIIFDFRFGFQIIKELTENKVLEYKELEMNWLKQLPPT